MVQKTKIATKELNTKSLKKKSKISIGPMIDTSKAWAFFDGDKSHVRVVCGAGVAFHMNNNHTFLFSLGWGLELIIK